MKEHFVLQGQTEVIPQNDHKSVIITSDVDRVHVAQHSSY